MSLQKRKQDATWSGTITDWIPLSWRTWEGDVNRDETEPLTDGDGERQKAHEDRAGDADLTSIVVSEVSLAARALFAPCWIDEIPHALTGESRLCEPFLGCLLT